MRVPSLTLGALHEGSGRTSFRLWAPSAERVEVVFEHPEPRAVALAAAAHGYHQGVIEEAPPGSRYRYRLDGDRERPDPASRLQPEGVHGPSGVDDRAFAWTDVAWGGLPLADYLLYELHVGVFTPQGTFDAVIPRLDALRDLGVTAIELMPVAQFPGARNWGYDGVFPFAAQNSYGGPAGLRRLVDACHARGMAVVLDVVYNHLGPDGNYLGEYGPYFTDRYETPWGRALNFDGPLSDEVRRYFIENALYWAGDCHIDALRLDAIHGICDFSAEPFLRELGDAVHDYGKACGREVLLIAESDLNDSRVIRPREAGGLGLDAQWSDDFHHALHALLTGETAGYYEDFGETAHLERALRERFVYNGRHSIYRKRRHGNPARDLPPRQFVVFAQNHDQIGNRMHGDRLGTLVSFEGLKLAAATVLLSPYVPLLFMGEEYGDPAPFLYFVSHGDPALVEAVRAGRRAEFAAFAWAGEAPDPQAESTFERSRPDPALRGKEPHKTLLAFYKRLIELRRALPALAPGAEGALEARARDPERLLTMRRWGGGDAVTAFFHFGRAAASLPLEVPEGRWRKILDSADPAWRGGGSALPETLAGAPPGGSGCKVDFPPLSCALYRREGGAPA
ncbi:MAG: malto-oligosyltrehalose trehalohydrolase [Deltaproteobacteria bacterium]|nr:malto-oligosyltrehalose trehalohydrolase [Deltaproteobacteria bacterium]